MVFESQSIQGESGVRNLRMGRGSNERSTHMRKYRNGNTPCITPDPFL
jgi:hypothetical protein